MKATTNKKERKMSVTVKTPAREYVVGTYYDLIDAKEEAEANFDRLFISYQYSRSYVELDEMEEWNNVIKYIEKKIERKEYV